MWKCLCSMKMKTQLTSALECSNQGISKRTAFSCECLHERKPEILQISNLVYGNRWQIPGENKWNGDKNNAKNVRQRDDSFKK